MEKKQLILTRSRKHKKCEQQTSDLDIDRRWITEYTKDCFKVSLRAGCPERGDHFVNTMKRWRKIVNGTVGLINRGLKTEREKEKIPGDVST